MNRPSRPSRRISPPPRRTHGFSLIELMVVIAIAAIISGLAAPSFSRMLNSNRIQTAASALQGDLSYARTEAVKRGSWVAMCPSSNATSNSPTCDSTNTWQNGWITFADTSGNGVYGSGDTLLKVRDKLPGGSTIVASPAPAINAVIFNREGFTSNLGTSQVAFTFHTSTNDAKATRCVLVTFGGSLSTVEKGSTCS
jgi:type IV fimbrial biogenesis protein FimT